MSSPTHLSLTLTNVGFDRIETMKVIRSYRPDLPVSAVKVLIENLPATILHDIPIDRFPRVVRAFWRLGAAVEFGAPFAENTEAFANLMWPDGVVPR